MIGKEIKREIDAQLDRIEVENEVVIFYACESGSRGWVFESANSDYDVRFLYLHRIDWYLTIRARLDVIERPPDNDLDLSGWDIQKTLLLFRKSNPPLLEWLQSPIVYRERFTITERLRALIPDYYSPKSCLYHYLHMAVGNYREYLKGNKVWVKKYFYVLRPILACRWIGLDLGIVPIEFRKLVEATVKDFELRLAIEDLLDQKKKGQELDHGPRIPVISEFIESELQRLSEENEAKPAVTSDPQRLDDLFLASLKEVWGDTL